MAKLKGKKVRCDVCQKTIKTKSFRWLMVHKVDYQERYYYESAANCEKDLDICKDCIKNLNFKRYEK